MSLLGAAGLGDWIAPDADAFVRIAGCLATDRDALTHWRSSLRQRLMDSPLLNASAYAQRLHAALREARAKAG